MKRYIRKHLTPESNRNKPKPPFFIRKPYKTTHEFLKVSWNQSKKYPKNIVSHHKVKKCFNFYETWHNKIYITLISMALLEFKNFDFLLPTRLNLLPKCKCASIFMRVDTVNSWMMLFLVMQIRFRNLTLNLTFFTN